SLMIRADTKIGFDRARTRDFQSWFTGIKISGNPRTHVIETFFQFLEALGLNDRVMRWDIPVSDDGRTFAEKILEGKPSLVINPCTSVRANNWRNWRVERYAAVIDYAASNYGLQTVLTGGPAAEEHTFGEAIIAETQHRVNNMIGRTSLKQLQAILSMADVVIAPDTGPAHMAAAAGTPVIGLYASSNPERTGPYSALKWTVNKYPQALQKFCQLDIQDARWGQRVRDHDVMDIIGLVDVTKMLDRVMDEKISDD
ncbi:MAG TPA: glycosyl transferase, partial [Gammaproteobacteria bacterium]|nr:glycosyl transferase [Gammaproteobacteria bacterium]